MQALFAEWANQPSLLGHRPNATSCYGDVDEIDGPSKEVSACPVDDIEMSDPLLSRVFGISLAKPYRPLFVIFTEFNP